MNAARIHSEKAMLLSKKMRRSRRKVQTGHVICQHLKMMLAEELPQHCLARQESGSKPNQTGDDHQFSLGF